jgi:hypothetical protein
MAWGLNNEKPEMPRATFQALVDETKHFPATLTTLGHNPVLDTMSYFMSYFVGRAEDGRFTVFASLVRRLRFPDQQRAFEFFVHGPRDDRRHPRSLRTPNAGRRGEAMALLDAYLVCEIGTESATARHFWPANYPAGAGDGSRASAVDARQMFPMQTKSRRTLHMIAR